MAWNSFLDPRNWISTNGILAPDDAPFAHPVMDEGEAAPLSPWHVLHGDTYTSRERMYLDEESDLFHGFYAGEQEPLWRGDWIDCVSSWLVSYQYQSNRTANAPSALPYEEAGEADYTIGVNWPGNPFPTAQAVGADNGALRILYRSGAVCRYDDIPPHMALGLHQALSKGRWTRANLWKIWPYTLEQGPHAGARQAAISPVVDKSFLQQLQEREGLTEQEARRKNAEITARFRQNLQMPGFVSDLLNGPDLPELTSDYPELWEQPA